MNGPIHRQILVPIVAIQTATIAATTAAGVWLAAARDERRNVERLAAVIDVLDRSTFPLTSRVLDQMRGLSGARLVARDAAGDVVAASDAGLAANAPSGVDVPVLHPPAFQSPRQWPTLVVDGSPHYAARLPAAAGATLLVLYPESNWRAALWDVAAAPVALGLAAIALTALATRWFAERVGRRVHRLRGRVARIAEGDFDEIEPGEGDDEIADLTASVNAMSRQLREMRRTIAQTERSHLLAQLAAGFAHQLRNTLAGARLSAQLHGKRCASGDRDASLDVAVRQLQLAEEQVRGLLTLGRPERRSNRPCDVAALVRDVAELLGPSARHARVMLEVETPADPVVAEVDEPSVRAAALNLGWNALEAARAGGRVDFRVGVESDTIVVEVGDDGPGPAAELAATIFDPFVTGKPEGIGLGLALARRVAESHRGGLVWVRDDGRTRFRLTIPATTTRSADEPRPDRG